MFSRELREFINLFKDRDAFDELLCYFTHPLVQKKIMFCDCIVSGAYEIFQILLRKSL